MRRMYSGPELLKLDFMLSKYVNSSTESTVLLSTIIGDGVNTERITELCLGPRAPKTELGSFFIHSCESGVFLVNKQSDVVSIVNVRESELANLDANFTTETIHNIVHRSAKQGGSQDTSLPYTGGHREWLGEAAC